MKARAEVDVEAGRRIRWRAAPPVVLRRTGPARVHLVAAAGGPLGGDRLELRIRLAEDTELTIGSAGATLAQPGRPGSGPACWMVAAELAAGARLRWVPQPTVVCDRAELHAVVRVTLAERASVLVREEVLLGRHGQLGGRYRGTLSVDRDGVPLLRHTTVLDGADPALCGPAGTGGASAVGSLLVAGPGWCAPVGDARTSERREPGEEPESGELPGVRWAVSALAGGGAKLLLAVGESPRVAELLDGAALDGA
ncbi:MAG: urease accessory protein UreD [Pseudonocardia sp.]